MSVLDSDKFSLIARYDAELGLDELLLTAKFHSARMANLWDSADECGDEVGLDASPAQQSALKQIWEACESVNQRKVARYVRG